MTPGFCRDCLADAPQETRCKECGSPRLIRHAEIGTLSLAHVDCDAFYATIEKRDDPSLADKPLIVGGGKEKLLTRNGSSYIALVDARKLDYYHALEEEHAGLVLADAALEGLEDLAAGRIVDEAELDKALLSSAQAKKLRKV